MKILPANSEGCWIIIYICHFLSFGFALFVIISVLRCRFFVIMFVMFLPKSCHYFVVFSSGVGGWIWSRAGKSKNLILPARESFFALFWFFCMHFCVFCAFLLHVFGISQIGRHVCGMSQIGRQFFWHFTACPKPKWQRNYKKNDSKMTKNGNLNDKINEKHTFFIFQCLQALYFPMFAGPRFS